METFKSLRRSKFDSLKIFIVIILFLLQHNSSAQTTEADSSEDFFVLTPADSVPVSLQYLAEAEKIIDNFKDDLTEEELKSALTQFLAAIDNGFVDSYIYFEVGYCQFRTGEYANAVKSFTQSIKLKSSSTPKYDVGQNFFREHSYIKSKPGFYIETYASMPVAFKTFHAYIFRAECKRLLEDYRGAILDYGSFLKFGEDAQAYFLRGQCRNVLKDYSNAKNDLTLALKLKKEGLYYNARGFSNYNLGFKENACTDWSKAGELGYEKAYDSIKEYCK